MLTFISFSYKKGVPEGVDQVFDCRSIQNPHHVAELKTLTGKHPKVQDFVSNSAAADRLLIDAVKAIKAQRAKTLAFGCYGGRHRSVAVAEILAKTMNDYGQPVTIKHRELD